MNSNTDNDTAPLSSNPSPAPPPEAAELLTPQQTARKLNISRRCLAKWTRAQRVPMIKLGRVCRFDFPKVKAALERYEKPVACDGQCAASASSLKSAETTTSTPAAQ